MRSFYAAEPACDETVPTTLEEASDPPAPATAQGCVEPLPALALGQFEWGESALGHPPFAWR